MTCLIPINVALVKKMRSYLTKQMHIKDKRLKLCTEILNGIKVSIYYRIACMNCKLTSKYYSSSNKRLPNHVQSLNYSLYSSSFTGIEVIWMGISISGTSGKNSSRRDPLFTKSYLFECIRQYYLVYRSLFGITFIGIVKTNLENL